MRLNCTTRQTNFTRFGRWRNQFNPGASLDLKRHLINLVARANRSGGIVTPICFAVF